MALRLALQEMAHWEDQVMLAQLVQRVVRVELVAPDLAAVLLDTIPQLLLIHIVNLGL
jgi:hypothetical protein